MKRMDIDNGWAWGRVEAMADGSLDGAERRRFEQAMENDAALEAAVERARSVRGALRRMSGAPLPAGMLRRLLAVRSRQSRAWSTRSWAWVAVPAAAAVVAVVVGALIVNRPPARPDPRLVAIQEFTIAMGYLQQSMAVASDEVEDQVGSGLLDAFVVSRNYLVNEQDSDKESGG